MSESFDQIYKKYGEKFGDKLKRDSSWNRVDSTVSFEKLKEMLRDTDPTPNNSYLKWIVKSYADDGIKLIEDLGRTKVALAKYHELLKKNKLRPEDKDIYKFCGIAGCKEKKGLEDILEKYEGVQSKGQAQRRIKLNEAELVYESDNLLIIHPLTETASKYYGAGTRWCIAAEEDNMFASYNELGPLYIIIPKHPSYPTEKYAIHDETDTYMNEKDNVFLIYKLYETYPELKNIPQIKFMESNVLINAIDHGEKASIIKNILNDHPTSIRYRNEDGTTILMYAIHSYPLEKLEIIKMLLETGEAHPEYTSKILNTALIEAIIRRHVNTAKMLLATRSANPGYKNKNGITALIYAVRRDGDTELVRMILKTGESNPNNQDNTIKYTALHFAIEKGDIEIIKLLIDVTQLDIQNIHGETPLIMAVKRQNDMVAKILLQTKRSHPEIKDSEGKTALDYAIEKRMSNTIINMIEDELKKLE